jgi:hypothetical protein
MKKLSIRGLTVISMLAIALVFSAPSTAGAASTRAEYIAQVDPICQSFVAPLTGAFSSYHKAFKSLNKHAKSGSLKSFIRSIKRTARTLEADCSRTTPRRRFGDDQRLDHRPRAGARQ